MPLSFSREEVRQHLKALGYEDITDNHLTQFIRDLNRLIRFEEKQSRIQSRLNLKRSLHEARAPESSDSSALLVEKCTVVQQTHRRTVSLSSNSVSVTDETTSTSMSSSFHAQIHGKKQRHDSQLQSDDEEELDTVQIRVTTGPAKLSDSFGAFSEIQNLPPRPAIPTKPTVSFIRPIIRNPPVKSLKTDPVRLYSYYRAQWDQLKLPGDDSNKNVRWAVREFMMGGPKQ